MKVEQVKAAVRRMSKMIAVFVAGFVVAGARAVGLEVASDDVQLVVEFLFVAAAVYVAPANVKPVVKEVLE